MKMMCEKNKVVFVTAYTRRRLGRCETVRQHCRRLPR